MTTRPAKVDTGMGVSCIVSTVIHLAVFLLLLWWGKLFPVNMVVQETYYVDVVNLPVANPRAGSPTQKGNETEIAPPPPVAPVSAMNLPEKPKPSAKTAAKPDPRVAQSAAESSEAALAERVAKLERGLEARREDAVMERLRSKLKSAGSGKSGMPAASGTEQGSDYTAYIQSRLKDAFRDTISYSTKNPEMIVRLFIDSGGKLSRRISERSSGDRAFELAVLRAIDMASEKFTPPPDKKQFEGVFVFKPQGITTNRGK
ncbi:MAG: TonB C-terminal domain-containing protein [Steroidobacteraceae bacterium]|nr:TonB C-terminal domain-containing protein [Deltaproteobacteria bacterium]